VGCSLVGTKRRNDLKWSKVTWNVLHWDLKCSQMTFTSAQRNVAWRPEQRPIQKFHLSIKGGGVAREITSVRDSFCTRQVLSTSTTSINICFIKLGGGVRSTHLKTCIALFGSDITQRFCRQKLTLRDAYTCVPFDSHVLGKMFLCFAIHNRSVKVLVLGLTVLGLIRPLCN